MSIENEAANINIALVDDDENYLEMTKMYLEDNGMKITTFSNPVEALEVCKKSRVDIVLLDYFMPQMTGEEFVKKLREVNNKTLIILQTGFAEKKPPIEMLTNLDIQGYYDKTKDIDISSILKSDIDMDVPLLALYEILKQIRENNKLGMPEEIIVTVNVKIKENPVIYRNEYVTERVIVKKLEKPFIKQEHLIISDLSKFLYNLKYHIQELETHENIMADGITYLEEYK